MRRRYIALQPGPEKWRFAVAAGDASTVSLLKTGVFKRNPQQPLAEQLAELFDPLQMTDRLACSLPGQSCLLRWLEFPFSDPSKIAAAILPEMNAQLPENLGDRVVFHQTLAAGKVLAAAVKKEQLEDCLSRFDDNREPLGYLGITPCCYIAGLEWPLNSLLLTLEDEGIAISRIEEGHITDLRYLPGATQDEELKIIQQAQLLAHNGSALMRIRLLGLATDSRLAQKLADAGFEIDPILLNSAEGTVADELSSVASLAIAAVKAGTQQLNLRSGSYVLKNDWQALKRRAVWAAGLLLLSLTIFTGSGYLQYRQRTTELHALQQQMKELYHQQFPTERLRVAPSLMVQSKLKELQKKSSRFGSNTPKALPTLLAVSKSIGAKIKVDVREYLQNDEGLRLSGTTESFDAVSRLLTNLQKNPQFEEVRILDSKQAVDGSRVDFQLQILLKPTKGE
ncbi:MAG: PilN domain-containing protein [Geopsychrobacter sp.]|nr:PilN domain-containing protein [Geopsychrobacter sp.]